jgi:hypothetical protein
MDSDLSTRPKRLRAFQKVMKEWQPPKMTAAEVWDEYLKPDVAEATLHLWKSAETAFDKMGLDITQDGKHWPSACPMRFMVVGEALPRAGPNRNIAVCCRTSIRYAVNILVIRINVVLLFWPGQRRIVFITGCQPRL